MLPLFLDPKYGLHNLYICANNIELFHLFLIRQVSCRSEMETYAYKTVLHSLREHQLLKIYSMTTVQEHQHKHPRFISNK